LPERKMSVFDDSETTRERLDYAILQNSPIALYWSVEVFENHSTWFAENGYRNVSFDAGTWNTEQTFHEDLKANLEFPEYYGMNLDALNDCLGDLDFSDCDGIAIAVRNYHAFSESFPRAAQVFLDVVADNSWNHLLFGKRLVSLVQTDKANAVFAPVGARPVMWNPEEWLNIRRGL
jgi:RNAse (barnase) inhibitor barstar